MSGKGPRAPRASAASDNYARTSSHSNNKFDIRNPSALAPEANDPDYDAETSAILNLDEIGASSRGVKRNAVNLDGYDSDSSNEGFSADKKSKSGQDAKGKGKGKPAAGADNQDDEGDDMFGGLDEEEEENNAQAQNTMGGGGGGGKNKKGKQDVRFLELNEIEGQEFDSNRQYNSHKGHRNPIATASEDDSDSDEDGGGHDEIDEEIGAGGKKKNAPKLEAFNMKAEMEEGRFDAEGNFVRRAADADAVHDNWLQGVSRKEMKRAREYQEKREQEAKQKILEEDAVLTSSVLSDLILCLNRGETVLEALARLADKKTGSSGKAKKSWQNKARQRKNSANMDVDNDTTTNSGGTAATGESEVDHAERAKEEHRKAQVDKITAAANTLLSRGNMDIYEESRESLTRSYKRETGDDWEEPQQTKDEQTHDDKNGAVGDVEQWEYKWTDDRDDGEVYGPFPAEHMKAWRVGGFFGEGVAFRRVGEGSDGWDRLGDF